MDQFFDRNREGRSRKYLHCSQPLPSSSAALRMTATSGTEGVFEFSELVGRCVGDSPVAEVAFVPVTQHIAPAGEGLAEITWPGGQDEDVDDVFACPINEDRDRSLGSGRASRRSAKHLGGKIDAGRRQTVRPANHGLTYACRMRQHRSDECPIGSANGCR